MMTEVVGLSHAKASRLSVSTDEVIVPRKHHKICRLPLNSCLQQLSKFHHPRPTPAVACNSPSCFMKLAKFVFVFLVVRKQRLDAPVQEPFNNIHRNEKEMVVVL